MISIHLLTQSRFKQKTSLLNRLSILLFSALFITACSSPSHDQDAQSTHTHSHNGTSHNHNNAHSKTEAKSQINLSQFNRNALIRAPEIVSCTLENGTRTQCTKLVVKYLPDDIKIGPFCPDTLTDEGGIWNWDGDEAGLYRVDESFLRMLAEQGYEFYDENGKVHITDIAITRPEHDHSCINVSADEEVVITMLIPTQPVMAEKVHNLGVVSKVGVSISGVPIFSDAPSVQHTGHMPALDTCAGHIDPGGWYHYHGTASDLDTVYEHEHVNADCNLPQNSSGLFGYAFDGFGIYGSKDENGELPTDLDSCHGHVGYVPGKVEKVYHYHASEDFPNLPKCLSGVVAKSNFSTTAKAGVGATKSGRNEPPGVGQDKPQNGGQRQGRQPSIPPGFDKAAEQLGITSDALLQAMQDAGGPRADLAEVAQALGVSEEKLKAALPEPPNRR